MITRFFLLLFVLFAIVQSPLSAMNIGYGVKAGVSFSDFAIDGELEEIFLQNRSGLTNFSGGPLFFIEPSRIFAMQFEAIYVRKGSKGWEYGRGVGGNILEDKLHEEYNIDYLELPAMAKFYLQHQNTLMPYIIAGPSISIKLRERYNQQYRTTSASTKKDNFKGTDFGLIFGGGLDISDFIIEARYNFGPKRANRSMNSEFLTLKNRSLSIFGGYYF